MANIYSGCYECGKACINDQFCRDSSISLPNALRVKIIANPEFWGFDDGAGNVLTSGRAVFNKGHYDFFDGYDELHEATKTCAGTTSGPFKNEQRPDVFYRSVYDPEDTSLTEYGGKRHYGSDGTRDNIERGGMEPYLIDRPAGELRAVTSDNPSCDETDPRLVYKKVPENFGFGNKILATDAIFKNTTGAWRYASYSGCYDHGYITREDCPQCTGVKQQVTSFNPLDQILPSGYKKDCLPDGSIPRRYSGEIIKVYRNDGVEGFLKAQIIYHSGSYHSCDGFVNSSGSGEANSIFQGSLVGLSNSTIAGNYAALNVSQNGTYTEFDIAGTFGSGQIETSGGSWTLFNSYDPKSCCGGKAYNVSDTYKFPLSVTNYHADFGRIFNNSKNIRQSNRFPENRFTYNLNSVTPHVSKGVLRKDYSYVSISGEGSGLLVGNYPQFDKDLSYYGPFFDVDKCDYGIRRDERQNTTKGNNYTCYSSKSTLEVYPECFAQWSNEYQNCDGNSVVKSQQIPRLTFVYRGCDFEDPCEYNSSGQPYAAPTSVQDLRRGLAGQEIYMYVNLANVWTTMYYQPPCTCDEGEPGKQDPQFVSVPSPVTFTSFPKFDLYPEQYGCKDTLFQIQGINKCGQFDYGAKYCDLPEDPYACTVRQPYTTYGFMRNLCGKKTDDKRKVITESFANLIQNGQFRNTNTSGVNEPMYWQFTNPYVHESGGDLSRLKPSGDYAFWGLAETNGRLVAPHYRTVTATGVQSCGSPPTTFEYYNFDTCATHRSGWPTDHTPFLIEIDHDDDCVGCASSIMENKNLHIDLQSLDTSFSHDRESTQGDLGSHMYGWNHCGQDGRMVYDPSYTCESGFSTPCDSAFTGIYLDQIKQAREPYIGSTCGCIAGTGGAYQPSFTMNPVLISGTSIPVGWRTDGGKNSFVKLEGCSRSSQYGSIFGSDYRTEKFPYTVYGSFKLACNQGMFPYVQPTPSGFNPAYTYSWTNGTSPLNTMYNGGGCAGHYPSADSDLMLQAKFVAIPTGNNYDSLFELMPDHIIDDRLESVRNLKDAAIVLANSLEYGELYRIEYGCSGYDAYGNSGSNFFVGPGCYACNISGDPYDQTDPCDCAGVECDECGAITGVNGKFAIFPPIEYRGTCGCDCNEQIMRIYHIDCSGVETLVEQNDDPSCSGSIKAIQFSGVGFSTSKLYDSFEDVQFLKFTTLYGEAACSWHSGPNATGSGIFYEFDEPYREISGSTKCSLWPQQCDGECENDPNAQVGACKDPIPWTGVPPTSGVLVHKKSCFPEIMVVNKIVCNGDKYDLHVSREYHNHDRQWYYIKNVGSPPVATCCPKQVGAYSGIGICEEIPFCTPTDTVTPAYPTETIGSQTISGHIDIGESGNRAVCSAHYSSGTFSNQDFLYSYNNSASGYLWNYFNLFYSGNFPTSNYIPAVYIDNDCNVGCSSGVGTVYESGAIFPSGFSNPVGRGGIDWTNRYHSCLQDHRECGADIYCNKMFFPRRPCASGTQITRFGPLQICSAKYDRKMGDWYSGYEEFDTLPSVLDELVNRTFIDACDARNRVTLQSQIGIDDTVITVDDYLPLLTFGTGLFQYTQSVKSCTIVGTGCHILPLHTDFSVNASYGGPRTYPNTSKSDTMGYWLDKLTYEDTDNCLFQPFKILVDVECCNSVIRNKNKQDDDPTNLEYVIDNIPSYNCGHLVKGIPCSCANSDCGETARALPEGPSAQRKICVDVYEPGGPGFVTPVLATGYVSAGCPSCAPVQGYPTLLSSPLSGASAEFMYNPNIIGGSGTYILLTGADACPPGGSCTPVGTPLGSGVYVVQCGDIAFTAVKKQRLAYQCDNGALYIPAALPGSTTYDCCQINNSICGVLSSGHKIADPDSCFLGTSATSDNYLEDFLYCGCRANESWNECQTSIIKAIITEE